MSWKPCHGNNVQQDSVEMNHWSKHKNCKKLIVGDAPSLYELFPLGSETPSSRRYKWSQMPRVDASTGKRLNSNSELAKCDVDTL